LDSTAEYNPVDLTRLPVADPEYLASGHRLNLRLPSKETMVIPDLCLTNPEEEELKICEDTGRDQGNRR
jgi:hypothetical protein